MKKMSKSLEQPISIISKKYGDSAIMSLTEEYETDIKKISTGLPSLNLILGGGVGEGRIVEIFGHESTGKTTLALQIASQAQKAYPKKKIAYIDVENALDPKYAKALGVDLGNILLSQPDSGEEAMDIVEKLAQSNAVSLIVVDSVSNLVPQAQNNKEIDGAANIGVIARLMSQNLPRISNALRQSGTVLIFINQIRMKIGVMWTHSFSSLLINSINGGIPINKIVNNKIGINVYSYNEKNNKIEKKPIINWFNVGKAKKQEQFIHIETNSIDSSSGGRFGFTVTPEQKIMTDKEWVMTKNLKIGNKLMSKYKSMINGTLKNFLFGCFCGDSHLSSKNKGTASLIFQDNKNCDYLKWKLNKLKPFYKFKENGKRFDSEYSYELKKMKDLFGERNPLVMLNNYSDLSFAIWIMDDGNYDTNGYHHRYGISIKRFKKDEILLNKIEKKLKELGFDNIIYKKEGYIRFTTKTTDIIARKIYKYIPEPMQYKLPLKYRNKYEDFKLSNKTEIKKDYVKILLIRNASKKQMKSKDKFNISIKDNKNYFAGGIRNGVLISGY